MRELKFRAWDESLGRMVLSPTLEYRDDGRVFSRNFNKDGELVERPLMQYTGLKDQNGVEIYEGDIVRWDDASKGKYWRVAQVVWQEKGQWGYKIIQTQCVNCFQGLPREKIFGMGNFIYTPDPSQYGNILEVIGNIHENPELVNT